MQYRSQLDTLCVTVSISVIGQPTKTSLTFFPIPLSSGLQVGLACLVSPSRQAATMLLLLTNSILMQYCKIGTYAQAIQTCNRWDGVSRSWQNRWCVCNQPVRVAKTWVQACTLVILKRIVTAVPASRHSSTASTGSQYIGFNGKHTILLDLLWSLFPSHQPLLSCKQIQRACWSQEVSNDEDFKPGKSSKSKQMEEESTSEMQHSLLQTYRLNGKEFLLRCRPPTLESLYDINRPCRSWNNSTINWLKWLKKVKSLPN